MKAGAKKGAPSMRPTSEEPIVFGRVIAEREYRVGREKILLQIGTPHRASWKTAFYCPFRFVRSGKTELKRTFGVDAVQALMLAFDIIKVVLETTSSQISWFAGQRPGDVGISKRLTTGLGIEFDRGLERIVDKAVLKRSRELQRLHKQKAARSRKRPRSAARGRGES